MCVLPAVGACCGCPVGGSLCWQGKRRRIPVYLAVSVPSFAFAIIVIAHLIGNRRKTPVFSTRVGIDAQSSDSPRHSRESGNPEGAVAAWSAPPNAKDCPAGFGGAVLSCCGRGFRVSSCGSPGNPAPASSASAGLWRTAAEAAAPTAAAARAAHCCPSTAPAPASRRCWPPAT